MNTKSILPATGAFALGIGIGIVVFTLLLLPHYRRAIDHAYWADQVIEECANQYPDFYDTIAEGDAWDGYISSESK